jgi:hypothetical protein
LKEDFICSEQWGEWEGKGEAKIDGREVRMKGRGGERREDT